ncbi:uncharacterized protein BO96DRAFT_104924 [Aspergillus niger CBS 101883]|uniref:uncharacterized protein n=1 Tax=Aspergillus lacticoffeatus (strain CBS 101883) TaxID=1450533 RepID=UPI000D7FB2BF|nr:uncharacterized protein BO96DRAFT_104924 [Aspergillus niger CBS 101883]PYH54774.1 hypothetical protein BO96DRAFT_104924 [Aspergillus niger CBS 101883]
MCGWRLKPTCWQIVLVHLGPRARSMVPSSIWPQAYAERCRLLWTDIWVISLLHHVTSAHTHTRFWAQTGGARMGTPTVHIGPVG